jgi:hypothetical protein
MWFEIVQVGMSVVEVPKGVHTMARKEKAKKTTPAAVRKAAAPRIVRHSAAARGPAARMLSTGAVVAPHEPYKGKDVSFANGRLIIHNDELHKRIIEAFEGETQASHSAMIRLVPHAKGAQQADPDVIVDVRC